MWNVAYRAVTITDYMHIICHFVNEKYEFLEKRMVSIKSSLKKCNYYTNINIAFSDR